MKILIGLIIICVNFTSLIAQDKKRAADLFLVGNYELAIEEYKELLKTDPENLEYNYNIAVSYLNTNLDKSLAIPNLEFLTTVPKINADTWYLLGRAYHFGYQFDEAIKSYQHFAELGTGSEQNIKDVKKQIEYCQNAKELMKFPVRLKFTNLGDKVNSPFPDYYPFVPSSEAYIIYNSQRDSDSKENEDGSYLPNIYISYVKDGEFQKGQALPKDINYYDRKEEVVGLNADGNKAIFFIDDFKSLGDLYESDINGNSFTNPVKLSKNINSKDVEIAGCITNDDQKLYFASDRPGGYGGVDLYFCQRLPNGKWSVPQNLGPTINTKFDEDFPNISPDGKTLYFSSRGHTSMGGYDIFKANWDESKKKFTAVQNLGYPLNTPEDNMNFRVSESGKYGYISAVRKEGFGDLDIYRVEFQEVDPRYTVITGEFTASDGATKFEDVFIQITDLATEEVYGDYVPNERTLRYVMILPPGEYDVYVGAVGYEDIFDQIKILDKSSYKSYITKDIHLKKAE